MVQELELDALVKAGIFRSKSDVVDEALRLLFQTRPQLRTEAAIQLLKDGQVTLARAAEIAGVTRWEFEDILTDHGMQREVISDPAEDLEQQAERLSVKPTGARRRKA
jgi:predicted HTH domain antitoxin